MTESGGIDVASQVVDQDVYADDAISETGMDAEAFEFEPADPAQMPKPKGDAQEPGPYRGEPRPSGGDV